MTACASVADVLALGIDPAAMPVERIRRALGVGTDRATVVRNLAIEAYHAPEQRRIRAVMAEHRMSESEARDFVRMQQQRADSRARPSFPWNR